MIKTKEIHEDYEAPPRWFQHLLPSGYLLHSHGIRWPKKNRWAIPIHSMVIFHGYVTNNQMVDLDISRSLMVNIC